MVSRAWSRTSAADKASFNPVIGTVRSGQNVTAYVAYSSLATNLVMGGSAVQQVYLSTVSPTGAVSTILVSKNPETGAPGLAASDFPDISSDGNFIVFESIARNLTETSSVFKDVYLYDVAQNQMFLVSQSPTGFPAS